MCGINGWITQNNVKLDPTKAEIRSNIGKGLLIANESRGTDSTGVFLQNGKYHIISKNTCFASKFVREKGVIEAFKADHHIMLGHTRQATQGIVNKKNAHPFQKGNIVGVHNGIIMNDDELDRKHKFKIEVDSEIIFALLNKYNNNFVKTFKKIKGSASMAWVDTRKTDTLYLVAHENPMAIAEVPVLNTIFFTSEFQSLDAILQASVGTENYSIYDAEKDTVYTINKNITKTKIAFSEWGNFRSSFTDDEDADWKSMTATKIKDDDSVRTYLDAKEVEYLQGQGKKTGCHTCHKPLKGWCLYDELKTLLFCFPCPPIADFQQYLQLDLTTGYYLI